MSAIFVDSEDDGLVNLMHVVSIDKRRRARMSDGSFVQLAIGWSDEAGQMAFVGMEDVSGGNAAIKALNAIEAEINLIRCNL